MRIFFRICLFVCLFPAIVHLTSAQSVYPPQELLDRVTASGIRAHMEFLADDLLEGRSTGTRGYQLAANYVRAQFEEMGLEPAGDAGTYFQKVRFRQVIPVPEQNAVVLKLGGKEKRLVFEKDFLTEPDPAHPSSSVDAPLVFVGYGITAPERHYDDYAGIDARGKIAVMVVGAPAGFPSSDGAYYSDEVNKSRNAAAHGAVGAIGIWAGKVTQNTPWERMIGFFHAPMMHWVDANGVPNDYVPEMKALALLNEQSGASLFDGSGHTLSGALASLSTNKPMSFPLAGSGSIKTGSQFKELESPNIAAILRGSDPQLRDEYVVFTAHADHVGIGDPVNGDSIYNGAVDNASGTAALLEIARAFTESKIRPRRSLLFVVVTGEEEGLLGSDYFAQHPTVAKNKMVANVNMDGVSLFYEFRDLVALGSEHSTLIRPLEDVAQHMHLEISPDPMPEENFFVRSDQYSFVKQGVPALAISEGFKTVDPALDGKKITVEWITTHYHLPSDDMNQPLNFKAARLCTQVILAVGYEVAQTTERPAWNQGDIFGERFGGR